MVSISFNSLGQEIRGNTYTLADKLIHEGAIKKEGYKKVSSQEDAPKETTNDSPKNQVVNVSDDDHKYSNELSILFF